MRDKSTGWTTIQEAIKNLEMQHDKHIRVYGASLDERLTGQHETSDIHSFDHGVGNRNASIRIPKAVAAQGYGYLEDRRPGANADPYEVSTMLIQTICGISCNETIAI